MRRPDAEPREMCCHPRAMRLPEEARRGAGDGRPVRDGGERAVDEVVRELEPAIRGRAGRKGEAGEAAPRQRGRAGGEQNQQHKVRPGRQQPNEAEERGGDEQADDPKRRPEQRPKTFEGQHEPGGQALPLEPGRPVRRWMHEAALLQGPAFKVSVCGPAAVKEKLRSNAVRTTPALARQPRDRRAPGAGG